MHSFRQETEKLDPRFIEVAHETGMAANYRLFKVKNLTNNRLYLVETGAEVG